MAGVATLMAIVLVASCVVPLPLFNIGVQALLTLLACMVATALKSKVRTVMIGSVLGAILVPAFLWNSTKKEIAELYELRREYPVVSLEQRLGYESSWPQAAANSGSEGDLAAELNPEVAERLQQSAETPYGNRRENTLRFLHDRTSEEFIRSRGLGVGRMGRRRFGRESVVLPDAKLIPLPAPPRIDPQYEPGEILGDAPLAAVPEIGPSRSFDDLLALHDEGLKDFFDASRFGYVKDRGHVVGFEPHQFTKRPTGQADNASQEWQITRLELVSLLKHKTPRVYESKNLPRMDELADADTRPLDAFEAASLPQLETRKDLVVESRTNRVRMLGSLRAGTTCLQCHQVPRGKLLGAFSYQLDRKRPLRRKVESDVANPST